MNDISIFISIAALAFSAFSYFRSFLYERRKATLEAYDKLQSSLRFIYSYKKGEIEDFVYDKQSEEYKALSECLAQIEFFATGVMSHAYDFGITYDLAHGFLDMTLRSRIEHLLELKNENSSERFYQNTEDLLLKMDKTAKRKKEASL